MTADVKALLDMLRISSPCGEEDAYADFLVKKLESLEVCESIETDIFNNVTARIPGRNAYTLMLEAHYDEIGLIVTEITEDGFIRVCGVGGADRRTMLSAEVSINGLPGIICSVPPHIMKEGGGRKVPEYEDMYIDLGLPGEEVKKHVRVGDRAVFVPGYAKLLNGRVCGGALDNKACVYAILTAVEMLKSDILAGKVDISVCILFSTREETGGQGAKTGAYRLAPDEAMITDVTFAKQALTTRPFAELGGGVVIERNAYYDKRITRKLVDIAYEKKIKHVINAEFTADGTNGDTVPYTRTGVLTSGLSLPLRYMHTPVETVDIRDIEHMARLMKAYIKEGAFWNFC